MALPAAQVRSFPAVGRRRESVDGQRRSSSTRQVAYDLVRGLALLVMCVDHVEEMAGVQVLSYVTYAPIGISTGAGAFVFVSGLTLGYVFLPLYESRGYFALQARCLLRAWHLYVLHVFALVAVIGVIGLAGALLGTGAAPMPFIDGGWIARFARLGVNLKYFDILPLYILVLAAAGPFFALAAHSPKRALALAGVIYAVVQIVAISGQTAWLPFKALYYQPLAWQVLFMIGMVAGIHHRRGGRFPALSSRAVWGAAVTLLVLGVWYKGARINALFGLFAGASYVPGSDVPFDVPLIDKATLGPLRLLHLMLCAALVHHFWPRRLDVWAGELLPKITMLGRNALEVFVVSIPVCYLAGAIARASDAKSSAVLCMDIGAVLVMLQVARLNEFRKTLSR